MIDKDKEEAYKISGMFLGFYLEGGTGIGDERLFEEISRIRTEAAEQARKEERATIMSEIADGGKSCHWCIEANRRIGAEQALQEAADKIISFLCGDKSYFILRGKQVNKEQIAAILSGGEKR